MLLAVWDGRCQSTPDWHGVTPLFFLSLPIRLLLYGSARVFLNTLLVCNVDVEWGSAISLDFS
jgi:hypothetical protein